MKSKYRIFTEVIRPSDVVFTVKGPVHLKDEKILIHKGWNKENKLVFNVMYIEPLSKYVKSSIYSWFDEWKVVTDLTSLKRRVETHRRLPLKQYVEEFTRCMSIDFITMM